MTTDDEQVRASILRLVGSDREDRDAAHEIYADDAVLEFPQSGERFVGTRNFRAWRRRYPADVDFTVRRVLGRGDLWVTEVTAGYDGGERWFGMGIHEFRDGRMVRETIYACEGWQAPEWRAPWRAPDGES